MNVMVTIPAVLDFAAWRGQFDEYPEERFLWTVVRAPSGLGAEPERLYFVHRGLAKGWCSFEGRATDRRAILFAPPLIATPPVPVPGFRGWRYVTPALQAELGP
jgi:hypothetical protein